MKEEETIVSCACFKLKTFKLKKCLGQIWISILQCNKHFQNSLKMFLHKSGVGWVVSGNRLTVSKCIQIFCKNKNPLIIYYTVCYWYISLTCYKFTQCFVFLFFNFIEHKNFWQNAKSKCVFLLSSVSIQYLHRWQKTDRQTEEG